MSAPRPLNEDFRIAVVGDLGETMRRHDPVLASLTRLAAMRFDVATVLISIVWRDDQVFAESFGCDLASTDRDAAFCAHTIMDTEVLVVLDAVRDRRFCDNPLVVGPPFIRFYAGAPLVSKEGMQIGTLCLIDPKPREEFPDGDAAELARLADLVMSRINDTHAAAAHAGSRKVRVAEAASEARRRLLSIVGHEFRTPLNAISGFSDMIAHGLACGCDTTIEYAGHIATSATRLVRLVDRLLDYACLERGELTLGTARVPCIDIVREAVKLNQPEAMHHGITVSVDHEALEAVDLVVDPMHFSEAVTAIVGAAVAAPLGDRPVVIAGRWDSSGAFGIAVQYSGPSAPPGDAGMLFAEGEWDGDVYRMPDDGAGLGLPMTAMLVEAHGGSLEIEREGAETAAILWLPQWRVRAAPEGPTAQAASPGTEDLWLID